ncbi:hypothetical protein MTR_4g025890 [Medicago truncatula]|uniref:Uncharacterized protein n=1 Tax=Medicago truncatula TaxID=3880 RepID=A0A072UHH0_MEDTR|nr:hypothetical protein MTR_4g025890 [Medicago truncatula]
MDVSAYLVQELGAYYLRGWDLGVIADVFWILRDGASTSFWEDTWLRDVPLIEWFPRLFMVPSQQSCSVKSIGSRVDGRWVWDGRIPTRVNLLRRKVLRDRMEILCPLSGEEPESVSHLYFTFLLEDDGDDSDDSNKKHYPPFVMPKKMTNFKWVLGARFDTKDEFKEAIINYAI